MDMRPYFEIEDKIIRERKPNLLLNILSYLEGYQPVIIEDARFLLSSVEKSLSPIQHAKLLKELRDIANENLARMIRAGIMTAIIEGLPYFIHASDAYIKGNNLESQIEQTDSEKEKLQGEKDRLFAQAKLLVKKGMKWMGSNLGSAGEEIDGRNRDTEKERAKRRAVQAIANIIDMPIEGSFFPQIERHSSEKLTATGVMEAFSERVVQPDRDF